MKRAQVYSRAPLARAVRIRQMLQRGTFPNCSTMARELEVSEKTVMRDLEFVRTRWEWPIEYDPARRGYFFSKPVVGFGGPEVSEAELFALLIARDAMAQYKGTPFQSPIEEALRKLSMALEPKAQMAEGVANLFSFRPLGTDNADAATFQMLTDAVKDRRVVRFSYRKVGGVDVETREVRPFHLPCCDNHWYLLGFDVNRNAIRTFALPRIRDLEVTEKSFVVPLDFDAAEYMRKSFSAFKGDDDYEVVIEFDAWASDIIRGRQWHASQEITELPNGTIRFRMRLDGIEEALRWVLSWGVHATVVRPAALCNRVHEIAVELAGRYLTQLKEEAKRPVPPYVPHSRN
jgi:predicted DNA-binding transcriptional regulator YafY